MRAPYGKHAPCGNQTPYGKQAFCGERACPALGCEAALKSHDAVYQFYPSVQLEALRTPTQAKPTPPVRRQTSVRLKVTQYRVRARTSNPNVWDSSVRMRSVSSSRKLPVTRRLSRLGSQRNTPGR